jgi:hypothetical protein
MHVVHREPLEEAVERPDRPAEREVDASGASPCGFSRSAASAGDSVNELMAEMTVEIAIVSANCS